MTTSPRPPTATIHQFPTRGRAPGTDIRHESAAAPPDPWRMPGEDFAPRADFMSGWYHEAAICETDRSRKH